MPGGARGNSELRRPTAASTPFTTSPGRSARITAPMTATPYAPAATNEAAFRPSTPPSANTGGTGPAAAHSTARSPTAPSAGPYPGLDAVAATGDRVT
jgi:hypothetical protein